MAYSSSGATTGLLSVLREITRYSHWCALVDINDYFDPISAESSGIHLERLLWVRCRKRSNNQSQSLLNEQISSANQKISDDGELSGAREKMPCDSPQMLRAGKELSSRTVQPFNSTSQQSIPAKQLAISSRQSFDVTGNHSSAQIYKNNTHKKLSGKKGRRLNPLEQAFKAADILIQNGGFGLIAVDLRSIEAKQLVKVPLTTWYRFARVAERTQTAVVFLTNIPAQNGAGSTLRMGVDSISWSDNGMLWAEETTAKHAFDSATNKEIDYKAGHSASVSPNQTLSRHCKGRAYNEEVVTTGSKMYGSEKRKFTVSHAQIIKGAEFEIGMKRGRKPVQSTPKFRSLSKWK